MSSELDEALKKLRDDANRFKWSPKRLQQQEEALRQRFGGGSGGRSAAVAQSVPARPGGGGSSSRGAPTGGGDPRPALDSDYVMAPYRFVDIEQRVVLPPTEVAGRLASKAGAIEAGLFDTPLTHGLAGRLDLEWEAETPLLVGQDNAGVDEPLRIGADYWIPGSSLRGMIRSAAEICGFARLTQVNRHHIYPLRDFNHPIYSDKDGTYGGSAVSRPDKVQAGWLFKVGENADGSANYAIQRSTLRYIDIDMLINSNSLNVRIGREAWLLTKLVQKYSAAGMTTGTGRDAIPDFTRKTFRFRDIGQDKERRDKVVLDERGSEGVLVFSDAVPRGQEQSKPGRKQQPKQVEYAFLSKPDRKEAKFALNPIAFERFQLVHTAPGRNEREPVGTWKLLKAVLDDNKPIPIFYVGEIEKTDHHSFAFGLTRMFKIPHKYGVADKLAKLPNHALRRTEGDWYQPDMVEALFGYVHEGRDYLEKATEDSSPSDALKSRVAFSGARIAAAGTGLSDPIDTVMSAARASFAPFYLKGEIKDWSDEAAELAGRKRYLPRATGTDTAAALDAIRARLKRQVEASNNNEKTQTKLKLLHGLRNRQPAPLRMTSRIDLHNLAPEELGLLLFVLTHGGDADKRYRHMLGRAKPFGAGQLRLVSIGLSIDWCSASVAEQFRNEPTEAERPGPQREGWLTKGSAWSMAPFLAAFCRHALPEHTKAGAELQAFRDLPPIAEFLATSDPAIGALLTGPDGPSRHTVKIPPPCKDNYLRLRYQIPDGTEGDLKNQNPYQELRRATMPRKERDRPTDQPARLLPGREEG